MEEIVGGTLSEKGVLSGEMLLTISETARLMGVCENTLRDWDIEGKFKAFRTLGGHRRYALADIREYLEKNAEKTTETNQAILKKEALVNKWRDWLGVGSSQTDEINLARLLENSQEYLNVMREQDSISNDCFSTQQTLWLVSQGWLRAKLKKAVSIQALGGPCGLAFYGVHVKDTRTENITLKMESTAVAAKTCTYGFTIFPEANFEHVKNLYANAIAKSIDNIIVKALFPTHKCNLDVLMDASLCSNERLPYDYIAAPKGMLEKLAEREACKGIDLIPIVASLDPDSFLITAVAGEYGKSNLSLPIFMPYNLWMVGPVLDGAGVAAALLRFGWCDGEKEQLDLRDCKK